MDLPRFLLKKVNGMGQGLIELCPEEYDLSRIDQMLDEALAECEQLVLGVSEQTVCSDGNAK